MGPGVGGVQEGQSSKMASKTKASEALKVVARCRPLSRKEEAAGHEQILTMDVKLGQVTLRNPRAALGELPKTFTFDAVYDASSKQADLYDETVRPLVDSVLQGFNGTVFAYGQTGTGKTYTMQGTWVEPEQRGVIPNAFEHIFTHISRSQNQQYLVRASYLEIYQEEIRDLLSKEPGKRLELKENPETGVYIKDLSSFVTKNVKEIEHPQGAASSRAPGSLYIYIYSLRKPNPACTCPGLQAPCPCPGWTCGLFPWGWHRPCICWGRGHATGPDGEHRTGQVGDGQPQIPSLSPGFPFLPLDPPR